MDTKDYLIQFKGIEDEIKCLDYFSKSEFIQSIYDMEVNDEQRKKLVDIFNYNDDKVRRMKSLKMLAAQQIEDLDHDVQSELLYLRYVEGKNFADVANALFISNRHVYSIHKQARKSFEEQYELKPLDEITFTQWELIDLPALYDEMMVDLEDVAEPIKEPIKEESEIDAWFDRNK